MRDLRAAADFIEWVAGIRKSSEAIATPEACTATLDYVITKARRLVAEEEVPNG